MADFYSITKQDLLWSDIGDFLVQTGDLRDTREMSGLGFIDEIERRIQSSFGDWKLKPEEGANLHIFRGKINNEETWGEIRDSISFALIADNFLTISDFEIYVAPISHSEVAIRIDFSDNIKRKIDERIQTIKVVYDLNGQGPFIMR